MKARPRRVPCHVDGDLQGVRIGPAREGRSDVVPLRPPPLSHGFAHSTLRANPFPEVTDLFCRLPLPTLFYRPEAFHLGDLLRIWVRLCTKFTHLSTRFSRAATSAPDVTRPVTLYVIAIPISGQTDSRDHLSVHLIRKDNSSRNLCQRLWIHLCYHTSSA